MTSINVLHLDSERGYGGGQHQLKLLLQAGKEHGLSQAVACKHGSKIKSIAEHMGIRTIELKQRNDLDIASAHQLKKIIAGLNPDIIHTHTPKSLAITFLQRLLFKPNNKTQPIKASYINTRRVAFPLKGWISKKKYRYGADTHVCISMSTHEQIMDAGIPVKNTHLIHDGIILPKIIDPQASRAAILTLTGFQQHDVIVGSSGNLLPVKRFDWILHAIACAKKTIPNIKLVIFGEGQQKRSLQEQIQQHQLHDNVVLAGHQENPETYFAGLDVFCMASEKEGLCSSLVEAMGRGVPLLGSDTHGIRDVIQQNKNGLLFDANNKQDLCEQLTMLASNTKLRKQLARHSIDDAKKRFDSKETTAQYMLLYAECMKIKK